MPRTRSPYELHVWVEVRALGMALSWLSSYAVPAAEGVEVGQVERLVWFLMEKPTV